MIDTMPDTDAQSAADALSEALGSAYTVTWEWHDRRARCIHVTIEGPDTVPYARLDALTTEIGRHEAHEADEHHDWAETHVWTYV